MKCLSCGSDNPGGMKFCGECGAFLQNHCPNCGFENPPRFKFCGECGAPITGQGAASDPAQADARGDHPEGRVTSVRPLSTRSETPEAERRQLTVLFCDLVDSTILSTQLDPEELREVVRAYQETCAEVITRFEGYIAQYLGDGLLVYFGYPQAHEDDAQRAVRAGLGILEVMKQLNARIERHGSVGLTVRLGIHTGLVVVGEIGGGTKHEQLALGATPNIAARLQSLAEPDTVVISAATYRLIQGFFNCHDLGRLTLKGISTPVPVYRVLEESGAQSRLEVGSTTGLTPLVGREQEVGLLLERWAQAKEGMGQVVLLNGEAGIGKSRLVQALKERLASEQYTRLECRCSAYHRNSPFYPVIDLYQRALQLRREDSSDVKLEKLERALAQLSVPLPDVVPLLASLLSVPFVDRYPALSLTPQQQKQKTLEALLSVLMALTTQQPVLFILEDLHWIDPSTIELLDLLIDQGPVARILTLLTSRPDFRQPWGFRAHITPLTLSRLLRTQTELMVDRVAGGKALPTVVREQVVTKTDGVPLFVEELTKTLLESGFLQEQEDRYELTGLLPPLAIPATLHDSLVARLDRLAPVKEVAQLGATLGRAFSYELLQAVGPWDEATLQHALARLVEAELLYQRGMPPQATYLFKHALVQEAAYQSLLRSRRQQYHSHIAQVLEERFPEIAEAQPELLAHHYTEAGLSAQAIPHWQRAGQRAVQRSANLEAIAHFSKGLEVLTMLPDTPERVQKELALQIALGPTLMATKGYAAPEVEHAYARARELCEQVGETPHLFRVLHGLQRFYLIRAELQTTRERGEQLLTLAQSMPDSAFLLQAQRALGDTLFWLGEVAQARVHFEQGITLYNPQQHRSLALVYGEDPGVICLCYGARALWWLGYPDHALQRIREAQTLARELSHPLTLVFASYFAVVLHASYREAQAAQERSEAAIALSTEHGFALWLTRGTVLHGWALVEQGQGEEGITEMCQGLAAYRATGAEVARPYWLALLAEAYGKLGQPEKGLMAVDEGLAVIPKTGERFYEAELHRLKGELLLMRSAEHRVEAETSFRQALDISSRQQAKSLELRAAMSLSRLWQQQGKHAEARQLLTPAYGWFTEGFDTADLQEARALLDELSSESGAREAQEDRVCLLPPPSPSPIKGEGVQRAIHGLKPAIGSETR